MLWEAISNIQNSVSLIKSISILMGLTGVKGLKDNTSEICIQ